MSSPLPLRLCCMAAMAPALTEAATQARIRLPSSPTASPTSATVVNGREGLHLGRDINDCRSNRPQGSGGRGGERLNGKQSYITLATPSHLQNGGGLTLKSQLAQFGSKSGVTLANLGVIPNLPSFYKQERLLAFVKQNGDCHKSEKLVTMNHHPNTVTTSTPTTLVNSAVTPTPSASTPTTRGGVTTNTQLPATSLRKTLGIGSLNAVSDRNEDKIVKDKTAENHKTTGNSLDIRLNKINDTPSLSAQAASKSQRTQIRQTAPAISSKTSLTDDSGKAQLQLERRADFLLRRLRRLQTKRVDTFVNQQMSGFVDYQHANLQVMVNSGKRPTSVLATDLKTELLHSQDVKNLSTSALVSLVRKLQSSQGVSLRPRLPSLSKNEPSSVLSLDREFCSESIEKSGQLSSLVKLVESGVDSDVTDSSSGGESCDECDQLPERDKKNKPALLRRRASWKWAVDRAGVASRWTWLQAQVSDLEYRIRQQSEIYRQIRANKGTVVLGEAPSPEDLMAKFRASRPGRRLSPIEAKIASIEKKNEMSPCNISTLLSNVDKQSSRLTQSFPRLSPSPLNSPLSVNGKARTSTPPRSINGYVDSTNRNNSTSEGSDVDSPDNSVIRTPELYGQAEAFDFSISPVVDNSCQAARCRPVKSYRKRKLLRTAGLHQVSRKAARLSSVKCPCYPPVTPCAMCGGRYNNTLRVDPDIMPHMECISLLDSSTHPILSFPQDVPLSVHFEALMKSGEWQNKPSPKSKLSADRRKNKVAKDHGRVAKRYARSSVLLSTAKYRKKLEKVSRPRNRSASLPTTPRQNMTDGRKCRTAVKRRRAAKLAIAAMKRSRRSLSGSMSISISSHASSGSGSRTPTPSPQTRDALSLSASSLSATLREMKDAALKKKRVESDYDINNIVIPYSMAASTRVTRLKYKEIMTPKWRDITETDEPEEQHQPTAAGDGPRDMEEPSPVELDEYEDISDEAFAQRHQTCEGQEKKRFMSFVQYGRRVRGSRTESGANTPDPISPEFTLSDSQFLPPNGTGVSSGNGSIMSTVIPAEAWSGGITGPLPLVHSSATFSTIASREGRESKDNGLYRKRSGSLSRRERSVSGEENSNMSSLFEMEWVAADPWPLREFPLGEEEFQTILDEQPSVEELRQKAVEETAKKLMAAPPTTSSVLSLSRSSSPAPSTSTSISEEDPNDPNDPEWTEISERPITLSKMGDRDIFMKD